MFAHFGRGANRPGVTIRSLSQEAEYRLNVLGFWVKAHDHELATRHASALIANGLDVMSVSRRLGRGSPTITLNTYPHLFTKTDAMAADAIEKILAPKLAPK